MRAKEIKGLGSDAYFLLPYPFDPLDMVESNREVNQGVKTRATVYTKFP
jgi:hypothetical protein